MKRSIAVNRVHLTVAPLVLVLCGCAAPTASADRVDAPAPEALAADAGTFSSGGTDRPPRRDVDAIRGMLGEYRVDFSFEETVVLEDGYRRAEPHESGGWELVLEVDDTDGRIVLQHLLLGPNGRVIKHWRQDWSWEAEQRFDYVADDTWTLQPVPEGLRSGAWTQCVYEVNDAPRYCATGRWEHQDGGVSTWTGDRTWRPLPRRELTQRDDYNALAAVNRHTVTPVGWTHEQDNVKVRRSDDGDERALVREFGFNDYRRTDERDFTPAREYWERTHGYWADVRAKWQQRFERVGGVTVDAGEDGLALVRPLLELADRHAQGEPRDGAAVAAAFEERVSAPPGPD